MSFSKLEFLDKKLVEVIRAQTPQQRLKMAFDGNRTMRLRLAGHLATRHPEWTQAEIDQEVARRMLGGSATTRP